MERYTVVEALGTVFANGNADILRPLLADDCVYISEYSGRIIYGADATIKRMNFVSDQLDETSFYTYEMVQLETILNRNTTINDLYYNDLANLPYEYGLILHQYGASEPVAVVVCHFDSKGYITHIRLLRDTSKFEINFYEIDNEYDSMEDRPSTVKAIKNPYYYERMREKDTHIQSQRPKHEYDNKIYVWRRADAFLENMLHESGYRVMESRVYDDCIGYRCKKDKQEYTIFLFAYGKNKTTDLDGAYCSKLADLSFTQNSEILITYLNVHQYQEKGQYQYEIRNCFGESIKKLDFWRLEQVHGRYLLVYFLGKEKEELMEKFIYAFNHESMDIYDCILSEYNPRFEGYPESYDLYFGEEIYPELYAMRNKCRIMRYGYARFNDVIYYKVPYVRSVGYFNLKFEYNRIVDITCYPFDGGKRKNKEFIRTKETSRETLFDHIPKLIKAEAFPRQPLERFAVKLYFDNGACRKYILPIDLDYAEQEVISYLGHVFSDGIWKSAAVVDSHPCKYQMYPDCGPAIMFKNGFHISGIQLYLESEPFSEPQQINEVVYEDDSIRVRRQWKWHVNSVYQDKETSLLEVTMHGEHTRENGKSAYISVNGLREHSITFDKNSSFYNGLAKVGINGYGYGFIDKNMHVVIPLKYDEAEDFNERDIIKVHMDDEWFFLDKSGRTWPIDSKYQDIQDYHEGMCAVSTMKLGWEKLAYHSDDSEASGVWGYINEHGEEVISPQYIYAYSFHNGLAEVAKGKWEIVDAKGRYWSEEELWGFIDKTGKEVVPCIFDEIKHFTDCDEYFMAHYGGWGDGRWGVIDRTGEWVVEPIFEGIDYVCKDGLFAYWIEDRWEADDALLGIYDINTQAVLFEPQFHDVNFLDDGDILVEVYDETLERKIEKIIDRTGKERFPSIYSSIHTWCEPYEVIIRDQDGQKSGLIDKQGNILLPCIYDARWNDIYYEQKRFIFEQDGKQGMKDFNNNTIIPPIYYQITDVRKPLITVFDGTKYGSQKGILTHNGKEVLSAKYNNINWCDDDIHFYAQTENGYWEMYQVECK